MRWALATALAATLWAGTAVASGRWYAWLDRVSPGQAASASASWTRRGVPVIQLPSERFYGVDTGFVYLITAETLFEADARAFVAMLQNGGFKGTGIQYFSDAMPERLIETLGGEPVFAVELDVDRTPPSETVVLTRGDDGDFLRIVRKHADDTLSVEATHKVRLYDLPRVTEGERARVFALGPETPGSAIVFEAAFNEPRQAAQWNLIFTFERADIRVPPRIFFVPGARAPVLTRVTFESRPKGLWYGVVVEGLKTGPQTREMIWRGDRFVDAGRDAAP